MVFRYLDTKRNAFPRFFFISDDELLSVLGTSDPSSIQEHMLKLFDNCAALVFGEKMKAVVGMKSSESETFGFKLNVPTDGAVEVWMKCVEAEMRHTLYQILKEGVYYYAKLRRTQWIVENLGMVTLVSCANQDCRYFDIILLCAMCKSTYLYCALFT